MNKYKLRKISFGSYIKMMAIASFGTGLLFGLIALIGAICGMQVTVNGQIVDYWTGVQIGLMMAGLLLVSWGVGLVMFGAIIFPMLNLILKIKKGISFKAVFDEEPKR